MEVGWERATDVQDRKALLRMVTMGQAMTTLHDPPCLSSSRHRRVFSGRCLTRVCAVGGVSPALPTPLAWRQACPATCSSPAPAPSLPARCLPAASTSTLIRQAAAAPAPSLPLATASQRRHVSLGWQGSYPMFGKQEGQGLKVTCRLSGGQRQEVIGVS